MTNKKHLSIIVIVMAFFSIICLTLGMSYAYIFSSSVSNESKMNTGKVNASFTIQNYNEDTIAPMSDDEGILQDSYTLVTIDPRNQSTYSDLLFSFELYYTSSVNASITNSTAMPVEYIRVAAFDYGDLNTPILGPYSIGELPVESSGNTQLVSLTNPHKFFLGLVEGSNQSQKKIAIKFWLDPDTPEELDARIVPLGIHVTEEPARQRGFGTIYGHITDNGSNTYSYHYKLDCQQGHLTTSDNTNDPYYYNISVYEGKYLCKIYDIDNNKVASRIVIFQASLPSNTSISGSGSTVSISNGRYIAYAASLAGLNINRVKQYCHMGYSTNAATTSSCSPGLGPITVSFWEGSPMNADIITVHQVDDFIYMTR